MCYSTYVNKSLRDIAKDYDAEIDWKAFVLLYQQRLSAGKELPAIKIPEGMDKQLLECGGPGADEIKELRWQYFLLLQEQANTERTTILRGLQDLQELQAAKPTKGRADKIAVQERKIAKQDAKFDKATKDASAANSDPYMSSVEHDGYRIYPLMFAPVVIQRGSRRVIVPMRYNVLPASGVDLPIQKYPLYNARRDSLYPDLKLKQTWRPLWGFTHAIFSFTRFFESVEINPDGDTTEITIWPKGFERMHAACLYAEYNHPVHGIFRSVAICTDDPPREIELAGHDRCPIFLAYDAVHEWLNPAGQTHADLNALFDRKEPVTFEWKFMDPELESSRNNR